MLQELGRAHGVEFTEAHASEVRAELELSRQLGIRGVPFFVIDGQTALSGAQPPEAFLQVLRT